MADNYMTIKELADQLSVSKTTIRNHLKQNSLEHAVVKIDGVIQLNDEIAKLIKQSIENSGRVESADNFSAESAKLPQSSQEVSGFIELLEKQLDEKDRQIEAKDKIISELLQDLRNHQQSFLLQQEKTSLLLVENDELRKKKWWKFWS